MDPAPLSVQRAVLLLRLLGVVALVWGALVVGRALLHDTAGEVVLGGPSPTTVLPASTPHMVALAVVSLLGSCAYFVLAAAVARRMRRSRTLTLILVLITVAYAVVALSRAPEEPIAAVLDSLFPILGVFAIYLLFSRDTTAYFDRAQRTPRSRDRLTLTS